MNVSANAVHTSQARQIAQLFFIYLPDFKRLLMLHVLGFFPFHLFFQAFISYDSNAGMAYAAAG